MLEFVVLKDSEAHGGQFLVNRVIGNVESLSIQEKQEMHCWMLLGVWHKDKSIHDGKATMFDGGLRLLG